jgi:methyl-accepting chemotaxis protein
VGLTGVPNGTVSGGSVADDGIITKSGECRRARQDGNVHVDPGHNSITPGANMTNPKKQRSLKNILIIPGFQGRMTFFIFFAGFISTALNAYLYYSYVVDSYEFIFKYSNLPQDLIDERYSDLLTFGVSLCLATLLIILLIAIWALFMTHRAAGSVYHMKRVIEAIRSGNTKERIHLREKDEFQDVAKSFNQMMDELQKN